MWLTLSLDTSVFKRVYQQCIILCIYGEKLFKPAIVLKVESYNLENTSHILYKYVFLWCLMKLSLLVGYCLLEHCASYLITWRRMQEVSPNAGTCNPLHSFSCQGTVTLIVNFVKTSNIAKPVCSENRTHPQNLRGKFVFFYPLMNS